MSLGQIRVPRCYFDNSRKPVLFELHGFSDALTQAYGAVVYLRTVYEDGGISSTIDASKMCVAPVKTQTIELLAALIVTRLVSTVKKSLDYLPNLSSHYWTNSTVPLHWIRTINQGDSRLVIE